MSIKRSPVLIALSQLNGVDLKLNQHYSRVTDDKGAIFRLTNSAAVRPAEKMSLSPGRLRGARVTQLCNGSIIATKQAIRLALSLHLTSCQCVNRWTSTPQG